MTATELVVLEGGATPVRQATREEAEARAVRIRRTLELVVDDLLEAYRARDYVALGYGTGQAGWDAYLRDRYGDLRFTLDAEARRERLVAMHGAGLRTARPIAAVPGMGSKSLVATDLEVLREAGRIVDVDDVEGVDGKTQRRTRPGKHRAAELTTVEAVVAAVGRAGTAGATTLDVMRSVRWRQGPASAAMSRAASRGLIVHAGAFRDGFGVYTLPRPALEAPR